MLSTRSTALKTNCRTCPRVGAPVVARRSTVSRRAAQQDETNCEQAPTPALLKDAQVSWDRFLQRYEHSMLSSGIGAGAVTTWCMLHGQSPAEAAVITVASTITALVLNEVLFADNPTSL